MTMVVDAGALAEVSRELLGAARRLGERERALFDLTLELASSVAPEPDVVTVPDLLEPVAGSGDGFGPDTDPVGQWLVGALACGLYGPADTEAPRAGLTTLRRARSDGSPFLCVMGTDDERARRGPVLALVEAGSDGAVHAVFSPRADGSRGPVLAVVNPISIATPSRQKSAPRPSPVRALIGPKPEDPRTAEPNPNARRAPFDAGAAPRTNLLAGWGFQLDTASGTQAIDGDTLAAYGRTLTTLAGGSELARACMALLTVRASRGSLSSRGLRRSPLDGPADPLPAAVFGDAEAAPRNVEVLTRSMDQWEGALLGTLGR